MCYGHYTATFSHTEAPAPNSLACITIMFLSQCRTFSRWHASKIEHFILSLFHSAPQNMPVTDTTRFFGQNTHVQNETSISANWSCTKLSVTYALTACFAYKLTCKTNWDVCSISIFYHHQWLEEYQYIKSENVEHFSKLAYLGLYFFNLHNQNCKRKERSYSMSTSTIYMHTMSILVIRKKELSSFFGMQMCYTQFGHIFT